jgi:class 3 adenylate cyclase/tetratricopeptide (TPR) repeat protein
VNAFVPDFILQQDAHDRSSGSFDAAALFVDLSGFSALTESLVPHGREGAETLATALRFYFDPLVAAVHEAGGFITGFAGDACTALFPHSPHRNATAYALDAAHRMLRFVAEHPVYEAPYGNYPFSIRVGLSWGKVGWGIVRVTHIPLSDPLSSSGAALSYRPLPERAFFYFNGAAVDGCATVEHRAGAGEILFDAAFRRRVPVAEAAHVEGEIFRSLDPGKPVRRLPVTWLPTSGEGAYFLPPGVSDMPAQGEFRDVSTVFLSFAEVGDVAGLIRLLHELAVGYGGTFTGLDFGDKGINTVIHFGAPVAHENDTERALDFALELFRLCHRTARLRAGITRDVRWVGFNGGTRRQEFACLGRATNLAARLMMRAAWGDLLCDPEITAVAEAGYELLPRGEMTLKGFELPVAVHALKAKRAAFEQAKEFSAKELVGRTAELLRLLRSIEPIFAGRFAGVIHVDGEAGLGKSYLVETGRRRLGDRDAPFLWIEAPCDQTLQRSLNAFEVALKDYFQQSPASAKEEDLARFKEIFARLLARMPASAAALAGEIAAHEAIYAAILGHRVPGSLYDRLSPRDRFDRTLAAIAAWIRAESTIQPVVLHLEDAHWADGDTLRALRAIARMGRADERSTERLAPGLPVVILCTARPRDDGGPFRIELDRGVPIRNIALGPLSPDEIGKIAEKLGGRPVPEMFRSILVDGAGGNPLFAEEIFSYWSDGEVPAGEPSISSPSVALLPSDVNSLLVARLDRLPPRVKLTVFAAAVLGKEFDVGVLTSMAAGEPEVAEHVRFAVAQRIFLHLGGSRYRFRNTLLRNAAYEIQARARLQRMHLLAAEAIERAYPGDLERHASELARHYRRAALNDKARAYFLSAAREAASRYAHSEARRHYKSYLRLSPEPSAESVIARYELARDVYEPRGELSKAHDEHVKVIDEARGLGDGAVEALGQLGLGRVAYARRMPDEAEGWFAQAIACARRADSRWIEAQVLSHLGLAQRAAGHGAEAARNFERALRLGGELRMHEGDSALGELVTQLAAGRSVSELMDAFEQSLGGPATAAAAGGRQTAIPEPPDR